MPGLLTRGALRAPTLNPAGSLAFWMRPIQGPQPLGGCHGNQPRINQNLLHPGHYILWCYCDDYKVHYVYSDRISGIILFSLFFGFFMVLGLLFRHAWVYTSTEIQLFHCEGNFDVVEPWKIILNYFMLSFNWYKTKPLWMSFKTVSPHFTHGSVFFWISVLYVCW